MTVCVLFGKIEDRKSRRKHSVPNTAKESISETWAAMAQRRTTSLASSLRLHGTAWTCDRTSRSTISLSRWNGFCRDIGTSSISKASTSRGTRSRMAPCSAQNRSGEGRNRPFRRWREAVALDPERCSGPCTMSSWVSMKTISNMPNEIQNILTIFKKKDNTLFHTLKANRTEK